MAHLLSFLWITSENSFRSFCETWVNTGLPTSLAARIYFWFGGFNAQEMLALRQFTHGKISPSIYTGDHLK